MANEHIAADVAANIGGKAYILTTPKVKDIQSLVLFLQKRLIEREVELTEGFPADVRAELLKAARQRAGTITLDNFITNTGFDELDVVSYVFFLLTRTNAPDMTISKALDIICDDLPGASKALEEALTLFYGKNPTAATETQTVA
jgi:hypothetical protein